MVYEKYILKQNAFTLLELMLVIIIVSTLASLAIPKYTTTLEKARLGEGLQIIEALYKAQQAVLFETGGFANTLAQLDVTIPAPNNFNPLNDANLTPPAPPAPAGSIATVTRTGSYSLFVNAAGRITCVGGVAGTCNRIGCPGGACN